MRFLTDAWEPIELAREGSRLSGNMFGDLEVRHYALLIAAFIFSLAPIAWYATGDWGAASICVGLSILIASATVIVAGGRKRNRIA
jgi:hypothetical protein